MSTPAGEEIRGRVCELSRGLGLDDVQARDLEVGVYNFALNQASSLKVPKTWSSPRFVALYSAKARSILANIDATSYVNNRGLLEKIRTTQIAPHELSAMSAQELHPERWRELVELKRKRDEYVTTAKPVAMTNEFRCKHCKKRECIYQELQLRSADEPATIIVTCVSCGHTWRVG
jgi:transcription elongation factor S-II